jgi:hypothetical protein
MTLLVPICLFDALVWVVKHVWVFELLPNVRTRNTTLGIAHNATALISGINPTICAAIVNANLPVSMIGMFDFGYSAIVLTTLVLIVCNQDFILNTVKSTTASSSDVEHTEGEDAASLSKKTPQAGIAAATLFEHQ